jgi:putative thioredoxin
VIYDVTEADFEQRVIERSREVPVVVDFWAEWCGPCRVLGPALERAVRAREGDVELAKVDVDSNQMLAAAFGVRGIPAVKAFRDGRVVAEFTGAVPPPQIEAFLDRIAPSRADKLAASGDEASLRAALAEDPNHAGAAVALARILVGRGDYEEAQQLLEPHEATDFVASGLLARIQLERQADGDRSDEVLRALERWDAGEADEALEGLQAAIAAERDPERRDLIRRVMIAMFTDLGAEHPLAREHRRRLAAALN